MRWLYHAVAADDAAPAGSRVAGGLHAAGSERFVHCSYADRIVESAREYVSQDARLVRLDPRRISVPIRNEATPRGPMPHVYGTIPADAIVAWHSMTDSLPDRVVGHRIALVAFAGMTLLDLVGPWEVLSRISTMGLDPESSVDIISLGAAEVFAASGARLIVDSRCERPSIDAYDLVITVGGPQVPAILGDTTTLAWLATWPENRWCGSVCTGALFWAALGRLAQRRCTTHQSALEALTAADAIVSPSSRVVEDHGRLSCGGVTAGIDLGLHLVERLLDEPSAKAIAQRIEHDWPLPAARLLIVP